MTYLPTDHKKDPDKFIGDVNLWSAGKIQRKILTALQFLQVLCDSVQWLHESGNIAKKCYRNVCNFASLIQTLHYIAVFMTNLVIK